MWNLAASASVDLRSTKATDLLFSFGPLRALAVAAAVAQDFKTGASPFLKTLNVVNHDSPTIRIGQRQQAGAISGWWMIGSFRTEWISKKSSRRPSELWIPEKISKWKQNTFQMGPKNRKTTHFHAISGPFRGHRARFGEHDADPSSVEIRQALN